LDVYHTFHTWCGLSANLECMSEMCCTRLAEMQDATRWLYCVEFTQYSTRLEALAYLYV